MKFHEQLNAYLQQLDCMAKEVSELSGISTATLSRYRTGSRIPDTESDAFENLCSAIAELAEQKQFSDITAESVRGQFMQTSDLRLATSIGSSRISTSSLQRSMWALADSAVT
ncbi:MAG: hypothetical protein ACLTDR_02835 [Adlercreutzia equolifaciens]